MKNNLKKFISQYWILLLLIVIKFVLQFMVVNPVYELHRDEFLHLDQANHLAFGFISVPPLTSLFSKVILLLGGGIFWVRFFPAFFGALTIVFTWLIAEALGGKLPAKILASCAVLFSVLVRLNILFQPNSFDILSWTAIIYLLIIFIKTRNGKWLGWLAIACALGIYNKYTTGFLLVGIVAGILLTSQRDILKNKSVYKAIVLLLLLLLPNLIWQVSHHFPFFDHMRVLKANQLDNNSSIGFLTDQLKFISGSILLVIAAFYGFIRHKELKDYRFAGIAIVAVLLLLSILKAKNYYAFGVYPALFAIGSVAIERIVSKKSRKVIIPALIVINFAVFVALIQVVYPIYSPEQIRNHSGRFESMGMLRWEDGKNHDLPQDFADMLGWKEMAEKARKAYEMIDEGERKNTMIYADNYGQAGAINYYNRKSGLPEAYSFNTDYIFWIPKMENIQNLVLIGEKPAKYITDLFQEVIVVGKVENEYAREKGTTIFLMKGAKKEFTEGFYKLKADRIEKNDIF